MCRARQMHFIFMPLIRFVGIYSTHVRLFKSTFGKKNGDVTFQFDLHLRGEQFHRVNSRFGFNEQTEHAFWLKGTFLWFSQKKRIFLSWKNLPLICKSLKWDRIMLNEDKLRKYILYDSVKKNIFSLLTKIIFLNGKHEILNRKYAVLERQKNISLS